MPMRIELPDDLIHDLEQEATRQRIPLAEINSEALHLWRMSRASSAYDRERVMQVLRARGLLCELPAELAAGAQPLAIENWMCWRQRRRKADLYQNSLCKSAAERCNGAVLF